MTYVRDEPASALGDASMPPGMFLCREHPLYAQPPAFVSPRPAYAPAPPRTLAAGPPMYMPAPGAFVPGAAEEKKTNWLLYGGLGAGAIVVYLLLRKPQPGGPR